jgi:hypothetical protein
MYDFGLLRRRPEPLGYANRPDFTQSRQAAKKSNSGFLNSLRLSAFA